MISGTSATLVVEPDIKIPEPNSATTGIIAKNLFTSIYKYTIHSATRAELFSHYGKKWSDRQSYYTLGVGITGSISSASIFINLTQNFPLVTDLIALGTGFAATVMGWLAYATKSKEANEIGLKYFNVRTAFKNVLYSIYFNYPKVDYDELWKKCKGAYDPISRNALDEDVLAKVVKVKEKDNQGKETTKTMTEEEKATIEVEKTIYNEFKALFEPPSKINNVNPEYWPFSPLP
jgi:hypothetical protein